MSHSHVLIFRIFLYISVFCLSRFVIIIGLSEPEEWGKMLLMLGTMLAVGGGFWLLPILAVPPWYLKPILRCLQ